jgi:membrane protease YdiL (CAAX protease family)
MHPVQQLAILMLISIVMAVVGLLIGMSLVLLIYDSNVLSLSFNIANATTPEVLNALKILQMCTSVFMFLLPALVFSRYVINLSDAYLHYRLRVQAVLWPIVLLIMFAISPMIELMVNLNGLVVFPEFLKGLEGWMRQMEDQNNEATKILLQMNSVSDLLLNLLMIGVLPAIAEEFIFRGCLQTIFTRWTKNIHLGVWIAAILFSAIHMQFFGFLPRMMLGVLFGYLLVWSGSIWPAVLAHFINNATAVLATYFYSQKQLGFNPNDQNLFDWKGYLFSLIVTMVLLVIYRKRALNKPEPYL